jgi:phosphatidylethanolamine-binding protein (PEBP) family uncharacterized protein
MRVSFFGFFSAGLVATGMLFAPAAASAKTIGLSFSWSKTDACSTRSPAFSLSRVPGGAARLRFRMTDLDVPSYNHGGGAIAFTGRRVRAGAFSYRGPCPPRGQRHMYRWTVRAYDKAGKLLGTGQAQRPFAR